jgi:hypothetical protein
VDSASLAPGLFRVPFQYGFGFRPAILKVLIAVAFVARAE